LEVVVPFFLLQDPKTKVSAFKYIKDVASIQSASLTLSRKEKSDLNRHHRSTTSTISRVSSEYFSDKKSQHEDYDLRSVERFIDKENRIVYKRKDNEPMRPILPRNKSIINPHANKIASQYVTYKEKDVVEWNKYLYRRRKSFGDVDVSRFVFNDEEMYAFYVSLCEKRDSIPELPREKIEECKRNDPIFSKRHRQYEAAKFTNKAPLFDAKDYFIPRFIPKFTIQKRKQEIIRKNQMSRGNTNNFRKEMESLAQRTKSFIEKINIT
jgi:hypothetical protein